MAVDLVSSPELRTLLQRHLDAHCPGGGKIDTIERFEGGQSNPTYRLRLAHADWVMRCKPGPVARLLPSAHAIEREFRVLGALYGSSVPVARPVHLNEDESVVGFAFYLMAHVPGRVFFDPRLPDLQPDQRRAVFLGMNRTIAALHELDPDTIGLSDYAKPGNFFERQIGRWSKQYQASVTEPIAAMDRLLEWLPAHVPAVSETRLVHGDFRLDNLIFDAETLEVKAVLDWELSTLGDPLADFAYNCLGWFTPPGVMRGLAGLDLGALGIPALSDYLEAYAKARGLPPIEHFNFYLAYNLFRLAAISQGIAKRVLDGTAASSKAAEQGALAARIAALGWSFAERS
ncbi:MAG: phosphotransferase family protein [Ahniella sp.]|nr:phosphotransferase family protein [Ahniella sp.]